MTHLPKPKISDKAKQFNESVIREMTRVAVQHDAVNLAQGFPDFACLPELKQAASEAIHTDVNQYSITWGDRLFRQAIAQKVSWYLGLEVDPERQITVTCGSTEAMAATMLATVNPGDEIIVFEPFYENYGPDAILAGATPRYITLHPPDWSFDPTELRQAFNDNTKAIIINTPHNPTGKVFTYEELTLIAELCQKWDVLAFTDEIYEHILYGVKHIAPATIPGMAERTVTINGLSKTYSVTGWRVGYILANPELTGAIRKVHDFLTVGAPAPLQRAGVTAMQLPPSYYEQLAESYQQKRDYLLQVFDRVGIPYFTPKGAYYVLADISKFGYANDVEFTYHLIKDIGIAVVPGSGFFSRPELGQSLIRFCFSKTQETLNAAEQRLLKLKQKA